MFLAQVQILPGIDQYISKGIQQLGETASLFFETDRKTQKAIRNMLLEKPELTQVFADLEAKTPGTLKKLGFGPLADQITQIPESLEQRRETRLGERQLGLEEQQLGIDEQRATMTSGTMDEAARLMAENAGMTEDVARRYLELPTRAEEEVAALERPGLELEAQQNEILKELTAQSGNIAESMGDYVDLFRSGQDDPATTSSIIAHPTLGRQFELQLQLKNQREQAELERARQTGNIPVSLRNAQIANQNARSMLLSYSRAIEAWQGLSRGEQLAAKVGSGNQDILGAVQSAQKQLMGQVRAAFFPGPLSTADERIINEIIGAPTSLMGIYRGSEYVQSKLTEIEILINEQERVLNGHISGISSSSGGDISINPDGLSNEELEAIVDQILLEDLDLPTNEVMERLRSLIGGG